MSKTHSLKFMQKRMTQLKIPDFQAELPLAYAEEKRLHRSILDVIELEEGDPARDLEDQALIDHFGYGEYSMYRWDVKDGEYGCQHLRDGGFTNLVTKDGKTLRTLVFMLRRKNGDTEPTVSAAIRLMLFYHEIGHVDDAEKGKNFCIGAAVDFAKAEAYAHHLIPITSCCSPSHSASTP